MLELFSCAGFSEGHVTGDLRSPCARQANRAIRSAAPWVHPISGTSGFEFFIYLWEKIQMHIVEGLLETELGVPMGTEYHQGLWKTETLFLQWLEVLEMPVVTVIAVSKPRCWQREVQTSGTPKGTWPAQEELRNWSVEETSLMCLRGSFVCLWRGEVVENASFQGVQRASLGKQLGPFPFSGDGAGEGNHSAQEKLAAVELHSLAPISPLKGVFRQNG